MQPWSVSRLWYRLLKPFHDPNPESTTDTNPNRIRNRNPNPNPDPHPDPHPTALLILTLTLILILILNPQCYRTPNRTLNSYCNFNRDRLTHPTPTTNPPPHYDSYPNLNPCPVTLTSTPALLP